jgi:hypothetical protein
MNGAKNFFHADLSRQLGMYVTCLAFLMLLGTVGLYAACQTVPVADDPPAAIPRRKP